MNTGPYKEGSSSSEFMGSMTGGLSPVISSILIAFMTKLGVELSEATQITMYIGSFIVAAPSIVYYIKKRLEFKGSLPIEPQVDPNAKIMEMLLSDDKIKQQVLEAFLVKMKEK
jgi:hypothetical protein